VSSTAAGPHRGRNPGSYADTPRTDSAAASWAVHEPQAAPHPHRTRLARWPTSPRPTDHAI